MRSVELNRQAAKLRQLIRRVGHDPTTHALEMHAHWAKYICVLSAGYIENIVRDVYGNYVKSHSYSAAVIRYAKNQIDWVQNPNSEKLIAIARSFDDKWGRDLESYLAQEYRKDAVNSIISNRNLIAHGRDSDITVARISQYLDKVKEVAEFMEMQCES
jgi:hypothetical protein